MVGFRDKYFSIFSIFLLFFNKYFYLWLVEPNQTTMTIKTEHFLNALQVVAWIVFIGVSIEAGGFLSNTIYTLFYNPEGAKQFWERLDLSGILAHNQRDYVMVTVLMSIVAVLRALLFWQIVKFFYEKKFNLKHPFNEAVRDFISLLAWTSLGIGLFSQWGARYCQKLELAGVTLPGVERLRMGGADVWFFMGITLLVIAFVFKRGIEIQTENELTV